MRAIVKQLHYPISLYLSYIYCYLYNINLCIINEYVFVAEASILLLSEIFMFMIFNAWEAIEIRTVTMSVYNLHVSSLEHYLYKGQKLC